MPFSPLRHAAGAAVLACLAVALSPAAAAGQPTVPAQKNCAGPSYGDRLATRPWALSRIGPKAAWPLSRGQGVTVAVIDSGVSRDHSLLGGPDKVLDGRDLVEDGAGTCDTDGHGTMVAGIIAAAESNDSPYFYGVAPDARILPIRVLPDSKQSTDPALPGRIAQAVNLAVSLHADIINLSLTTAPDQRVTQALQAAYDHNVVVVAAAGNQGQTTFPAFADHVIAVGGVDRNGQQVQTSNSGPGLDLAAPGTEIVGPAPRGNGFAAEPAGGTSFAAAYVSGVAALIRAYDRGLSAAEVERRMELTADIPAGGRNNSVGYGVVNPYRALASLLSSRNDAAPRPSGKLPPVVPGVDPLTDVKRIAGWLVAGGVVLSASLYLGLAVLPRARARRWRPG